jgi:hypothetical protein
MPVDSLQECEERAISRDIDVDTAAAMTGVLSSSEMYINILYSLRVAKPYRLHTREAVSHYHCKVGWAVELSVVLLH